MARTNPARRQALVDAAIEVLAAQGARGLTFRAVDVAAGVPTGTASNYFPNRDALLFQAGERVYERLGAGAEQVVVDDDEPRDRTLMVRLMVETVERIVTYRTGFLALLELRLEATRRPELREVLSARVQADLASNVAIHEAWRMPGDAVTVRVLYQALNWLAVDALTLPELLDGAALRQCVTEAVERIPPAHGRMTEHPLQRRTVRVLLISQVLAGAGFAAGVTVGALLAEDMLGSTGSAGIPVALMTVGSVLTAVGVGRISHHRGRRPGLATGYVVGALGGFGVVIAAALDSPALLLASFLLYGAGTATNLQARHAGADLATPARRGRAVSTVLVATTLGAVIGPNVTGPTGELAATLGLPALSGPFLLAGTAYALAAVSVTALLRPDPLLVARADAQAGTPRAQPASAAPLASGTAPAGAATPAPEPMDERAVWTGAGAMVLTQLVMVAVMTMTPIHMRDHGHSVGEAGFVISMHVAAMFLPSPLTGRLVDQLGRRPMIAAAGATLLVAGLVAAAAPADSMALLTFALVLLGLGWNFGLVGGTALLTDAVPLSRRPQVQGMVDVGVALSGSAGGVASGFVVASASYAALSFGGGLLALLLLPVLLGRPSGAPGADPST
ncbi:MAG: MFS transporter [Patulibacter minatonensis]